MLMKYLLEKLDEEIRPQLQKHHCLHYKNKLKKCEICASCCPQKAITAHRTSIDISRNLCNGCGVCIGVCPVQAISLKGFELDEIIKEVVKKPIPIVSCSKNSDKGNITVPCLNGLHAESLATLLLIKKEKEVFFNRHHCTSCKNDNQGFDQAYSTAQRLLSILGVASNFSIVDSDVNFPPSQDQQFTRRELFAFFRGETKDVAVKAVDHAAEKIVGEKKKSREINRSLFFKALQSVKVSNVTILPNEISLFSNWKVLSECDGCGLCQNVCPSQAWQVNKTPEMIEVKHNMSLCHSCKLCKSLCPKKSIVESPISLNSINTLQLKYVLSLENLGQCNKI